MQRRLKLGKVLGLPVSSLSSGDRITTLERDIENVILVVGSITVNLPAVASLTK